MDNNNPATNAHTPVTLMAVFASAFKIERESSILWLKGVYQDRKRRSYEGYYYDRLQDEIGGQIITVKLPERIKQTIEDGGLYVFKGILDKDVRRDGVIEPVFIVVEMAERVASLRSDGIDRRVALQQQKADAGYQDLDQAIIQKLFQGEQPRIALICGKTSIVLQDVFSALKEAKTSYELVEHRVNLLSKKAIIGAFVHLDNNTFDVVAIIRGGGPGLEIFDDVEIVEAGLKLRPILVTAIGHAQDITLLQQIADKKFTTPTALGSYLGEMVEAVREETTPSKTELSENLPPSNNNRPKISAATWITISLILLIISFVLGIVLGGLR